jgi:hypothetical protein
MDREKLLQLLKRTSVKPGEPFEDNKFRIELELLEKRFASLNILYGMIEEDKNTLIQYVYKRQLKNQ